MQPSMTAPERRLFENTLSCSENFLEFGSGGSNCEAAARVKGSILSVDSSLTWVEKVTQTCAAQPGWVQPQMLFVDIGPTGNWGFPLDPTTRTRWPSYHTGIWDKPMAANADLFLVDGRFRVACCLQILLHARSNALIAFHDYDNRTHYHVVAPFMRPVAQAGYLTLFLRRPDYDQNQVRHMIRGYAFVAD
ncbi:MAG: hypothetical protein NTY94_08705 [Alphaproteobacteria bacterium]|nr:hypothetical protein [Alphaproteobacteria bacterium]